MHVFRGHMIAVLTPCGRLRVIHSSHRRYETAIWICCTQQKNMWTDTCIALTWIWCHKWHFPLKLSELILFFFMADMTMDEVREFERNIQEATNQKIGMFPPSISISETPLSSCALTGPASAPSTPMCTDAPESLSVPKDRPRKKSAPESLTLPDPTSSGVPQGSNPSPLPNSDHLQLSAPPLSCSYVVERDEQ